MGHEIVYCSFCAERILGAEFEKGRALRSGHRVACATCRPALLAELGPRERAALETPPTVRVAAAPSRPSQIHGSTARMKHAEGGGGGGKPVSWLPIAVGGAVVVLVLASFFMGGKPPTPVVPPPRTPTAPRSAVINPPPPAESPRVAAARVALAEATRSGLGRDVDAAYVAWESAVRAADETPLASEALQGFSLALERRRAAWKSALEEGEREIRAALDRKDVPGARGFLENLRGRHKGAEWASKMDEFARRLEPAIQAATTALLESRPWTPIFDGKSRDFLRGGGGEVGVGVEGGVLSMASPGSALQTRRDFSDGEIRLRFEISGGESLYFAVRQGDKGSWMFRWDLSKGIAQLEGSVHELHFVMKGPAVRATLDGRDVPAELPGKSDQGCLQFNVRSAAFKLHSLEFRELR